MFQRLFSKDVGYQAFRMLQIAFIAAPLIAGLDKFFDLLVYWPKYLAPLAVEILGGHDVGFMFFVGVVEVIAGLGVYYKPKIFANVVAVWLFCIIINLLFTGQYFDIALRDLGLMLGALSLGRLSLKYAS